MLAAFGDPGHAFPAIALGRKLVERGHTVLLETWHRWREEVEREGMQFAAAPEYTVFPHGKVDVKPYKAAVWAAEKTRAVIDAFDPEVVVADVLTVAASLATEMAGRPWVTLIPHVFPISEPGFPPFAAGARLPRTRAGRYVWRSLEPITDKGLQQGRAQLNEARRRVGLPPFDHLHGGISRALTLVATFPQLEYPRPRDEPWMRVTGPLLWERPYGDTDPPPGDDALVLVAPSTIQDPGQRMLRAALEGLADEPVRVLATTNRRDGDIKLAAPPNARVTEWVSYSRTMPRCAAVICHAGHGTVVRALSAGVPIVACPAAGDMAENAARVAWAGVGVSLPRRLTTPRGVRLALRKLLGSPSYACRAGELRRWSEIHDGASVAAEALESFAAHTR